MSWFWRVGFGGLVLIGWFYLVGSSWLSLVGSFDWLVLVG